MHSKQFGFLGKRSTVEAITDTIEKIRIDNSSKIKSICTFLDLKKAFDTVDHKLFLQRCADYGLRGPVLAVLQDDLSTEHNLSSLQPKSLTYKR